MDFYYNFGLLQIMFNIVFFIVIGVFVSLIIKNLTVWNKNNHSPRLTVDARVVSKRMDVSYYSHGVDSGGTVGSSGNTSYYVSFQVESGDRLELKVAGEEYGQLAEGDEGKLSFQGSRYLGFKRQMQ